MSRDIDHLVATHKEARRRQREGLPVWDVTLDFRGLVGLPFEEMRAEIVRRLNAFTWWTDRNESIRDLIFEFEEAEDFERIAQVMDWLYDEADNNRVWIKTF